MNATYDPEQVINDLAAENGALRATVAKLRSALAAQSQNAPSEEASS